MMKRKQAFTLIELLVVVAIIGILAATGITSYMNALKSGRDAKRKSDLSNIQQAEVLYRYEQQKYTSNVNTLVSNGYLNAKPVDPSGGGNYSVNTCSYGGTSDVGFYACVLLETQTGNSDRSGNCDTGRGKFTQNTSGQGWYYCVTNP